MNKLKINIRKGFTLVEVVIAVAVFAVMVVMVLMIMQSAVRTSKKASDEETNLNALVENVVRDESQKRYGEYDSNVLNMAFAKGETVSDSAAANFKMTYSLVDGSKNYVTCPNCEHRGNIIEFMAKEVYNSIEFKNEVIAAEAAGINIESTHRLSHWFKLDSMNFYCPECDHKIDLGTDVDLICQSCENKGKARGGKFTLDGETGDFICDVCHSGNVRQDNVDIEAGFAVSGMAANTLRYSNLKEKKTEDKAKLITVTASPYSDELADDEKKVQVILDYNNLNKSSKVEYTLTLKIPYFKASEARDITLRLPGSYIIDITQAPASLSWTMPDKDKLSYMNSETDRLITFNNVKKSTVGSEFKIKFTLRNYVNNNSFEYDYAEEGGLLLFWFGMSPTGYSSTGGCSGNFFTTDEADKFYMSSDLPSKKSKTE